jgi:hypothetical protein
MSLRGVASSPSRVGRDARDAEVAQEPASARGLDQDVVRLDVAMDHALGVAGVQAGRRASQGGQRVVERVVHLDQPIAQCAPHHQLHREVRHQSAVVELPLGVVVDRDHVGVLDPGHRGRLAREPQEVLLLGLAVAEADDLQRDVALQARVLGLVHRAHPARSDHPDDPVTVDGVAFVQCGSVCEHRGRRA